MKIWDKMLEFEEMTRKMNPGMDEKLLRILTKVFMTGASAQRYLDVEICKDIQLRSQIDGVPQPGAMSAQKRIEET